MKAARSSRFLNRRAPADETGLHEPLQPAHSRRVPVPEPKLAGRFSSRHIHATTRSSARLIRIPMKTRLVLCVALVSAVDSLVGSRTALLLHKPKGCVTTHVDNRDLPADHEERQTVYDHLPAHLLYPWPEDGSESSMSTSPRWHAVGRLDLKTSGLLIMTTDGGLVHHATSPSTKLVKTYEALCMGHLVDEDMERLSTGVDLAGGLGMSAPCVVKLEGYEGRAKTRWRSLSLSTLQAHARRSVASVTLLAFCVCPGQPGDAPTASSPGRALLPAGRGARATYAT